MTQHDTAVVTLSAAETMRIEAICLDNDSDGALVFVKELRARIRQTARASMKSHLDSREV